MEREIFHDSGTQGSENLGEGICVRISSVTTCSNTTSIYRKIFAAPESEVQFPICHNCYELRRDQNLTLSGPLCATNVHAIPRGGDKRLRLPRRHAVCRMHDFNKAQLALAQISVSEQCPGLQLWQLEQRLRAHVVHHRPASAPGQGRQIRVRSGAPAAGAVDRVLGFAWPRDRQRTRNGASRKMSLNSRLFAETF